MKQESIEQQLSECNSWIDALRKHRDTITAEKKKLQEISTHTLPKEKLVELEHFQNQFEIQLKNISHVKHNMKQFVKELTGGHHEMEKVVQHHEKLFQEYTDIQKSINEINKEFETFSQTA